MEIFESQDFWRGVLVAFGVFIGARMGHWVRSPKLEKLTGPVKERFGRFYADTPKSVFAGLTVFGIFGCIGLTAASLWTSSNLERSLQSCRNKAAPYEQHQESHQQHPTVLRGRGSLAEGGHGGDAALIATHGLDGGFSGVGHARPLIESANVGLCGPACGLVPYGESNGDGSSQRHHCANADAPLSSSGRFEYQPSSDDAGQRTEGDWNVHGLTLFASPAQDSAKAGA